MSKAKLIANLHKSYMDMMAGKTNVSSNWMIVQDAKGVKYVESQCEHERSLKAEKRIDGFYVVYSSHLSRKAQSDILTDLAVDGIRSKAICLGKETIFKLDIGDDDFEQPRERDQTDTCLWETDHEDQP